MLEGCIDYAGLFPPDGLDMESSVRNYAHYRCDELGWALGRFILPVSLLEEFNFSVGDTDRGEDTTETWRLSILAGEDLEDTIDRVNRFNKWHEERKEVAAAVIDTIEVKTPTTEIVERAADFIPDSMTLFCEVPIGLELDELLAKVARVGACAKVRTGGVLPELIPSVSEVAGFLMACRRSAVPFKATAGLHHPLRSERPLTYEPVSPKGVMHGFINVLLAAAFSYNGMEEGVVVDLLSEESQDTFRFEENTVSWREHRMTTEALAKARMEFAISFGSCAFDEPFEDLKGLNLI